MIYPIFIFKTECGEFDGYFPDVDGCFFAGETVEDAIKDSTSAFAEHCTALVGRGGNIPEPSDKSAYIGDDRLKKDGGFLALVNINPKGR